MKIMKWRRKQTSNKKADPGSKGDPETDVKSHCSRKGNPEADGKSVTSKPAKKAEKKKTDKNTKKPKWALARPPPVQTSYNDEAKDMPRISMALSTKQLQQEAMARGIERKYMPSNKADLLDFLVDGSIHLRKTKAWKDVEKLKSKMEEDCRRIEEERSKTSCDTGSVSDPSDGDKFQPRELSEALRDLDLPDPVTFSTRDPSHLSSISTLPSRHVFNSYKRRDRSIVLRPERSMSIRPDLSFQSQADETAVGHLMRLIPGPFNCGIPACSAKESRREPLVVREKADRRKEEELDEVIERRNQQKEVRKKECKELQQKMSVKWDASVQFEPWIVSPPQNNQKPTGSMTKGFTVWCSISSDVLDSPPKLFDSTFKSLGDANDRARYMFYWRNPWRLSPPEMVELVVVKSDTSSINDCASTFHCVHPNGDKWIVSVVHDSTFKYLDNASTTRHALDQDAEN